MMDLTADPLRSVTVGSRKTIKLSVHAHTAGWIADTHGERRRLLLYDTAVSVVSLSRISLSIDSAVARRS